MIQHLSIYLDEAGDLGFTKLNQGSSSYFVVTLLVSEDYQVTQNIKQAVIRTLKNKLNHKKNKIRRVNELKGSATTFAIKKYFFQQLPENGWQLYTVILNKNRVLPHLQNKLGKKKLYNFLAKFLIEKIEFPLTLSAINLVVDKCKNTTEIKDFNAYVVNQLQASLPHLSVRFDINHEASYKIHELQAVDLFCWGIARKESHKDKEWYNLFKHKIKFETVYLRQ